MLLPPMPLLNCQGTKGRKHSLCLPLQDMVAERCISGQAPPPPPRRQGHQERFWGFCSKFTQEIQEGTKTELLLADTAV